ncbi:hypothetical protein HYV80_03470 [Candidatus Woesearchaeota archaeon]|nr:hypothetical protein [Candidatus Woesearchaeota archaeon]
MEGLVITSKGIEEISALEVKELISADCRIEECAVLFNFRKFEELCLLCYKCQSADRILCLIGSFEFGDFFGELQKFIEKSGFGGWMGKCSSFKVECTRIGQHDFKSVDAETKAAEILLKKYTGKKIGIKSQDILFFALIVNNKCYFGVDFAGFELNKRAYKIFLHPNSLRGTIAYALVRESGFKKNETVLDPFSRDGVVVIESAFYASGFPVNYYKKEKFAFLKLDLGIDYPKLFGKIDKKAAKKLKSGIYSFDHSFKYVDYSRKNAKIAGIGKLINFSRTELEWLDIKFSKESVDRIITSMPSSKNADLGKIYNEFFYQAEFVLKKSGLMALIVKMPELVNKHAEKHNFIAVRERQVWSGEQPLKIIVFKKKSI